MSQSLLEVCRLRTHFFADGPVVKVVNGLNLNLPAGKILGLVGESGCGKTIAALSIMGLLPNSARVVAGKVLFQGQNLLELPTEQRRQIRGRDIAMIFQEPMTALNPVLSVEEQIAEVLRLHTNMNRSARHRRIIELLDKVQLADAKAKMHNYPYQLSGGMRQRVMIAIALAGEPKLLIADEPTTALDVTVQAQILDLLLQLRTSENMSMIMITHDMGVAAEVADSIAVMYAGQIIELASASALVNHPKHPYTQGLLAAIPDLEEHTARLKVISGSVPDLSKLPIGCSFAPRCEHRFADGTCERSFPDMHVVGDQHEVACYLYDS